MNSPIWQEARNAEGRAYYYNVQTKATQWQKPAELMTTVEVCDPNGRFLGTLTNTFFSFLISVLWRINLGKSILRKEVASIGTIQRISRAPGKFPTSIRMRWNRLRPRQLLKLRMSSISPK